MIRAWERSTVSGTARPARKARKNVLDTLVISSWQPLSFTSVCRISYYLTRKFLFVLLLTRTRLGFLTKVKKLLETVCHNCGKIKANTVSHPLWDGKSYMAICADIGPVRSKIFRSHPHERSEEAVR